MQVDLAGLRALVTGSTKGIGRAVAHKLAASGAEVTVNGRKAADVAATSISWSTMSTFPPVRADGGIVMSIT